MTQGSAAACIIRAIAILLGPGLMTRAEAGQAPCEQIVAAWQGAGFLKGAAGGGNGPWVDCVKPIVEGTRPAHQTSRPLPQVDPASVDGRSLVPLLSGQEVAPWRSLALVEHHGPHDDPADPDAPATHSGNPTAYEAIRSPTSLYVEYADGEREYHDLAADPDELHNRFSLLSGDEKASPHNKLAAIENCHGAVSCWAAAR